MIQVDNVSFSYTPHPFMENISFEVGPGEIFGFLGPSGAGKSTLQKILIGMLKNYRGSVLVDGVEVRNHDNRFYENIGIDFEFPSLYEKLTARQNLAFFGSLYSGKLRDIDELLASVELSQDGDKRVSAYSKGMKSRLNFIKALLHDPDILFLDEPTSGLDPANSRLMKDIILAERTKGKTIILTTHNMGDAAELCGRVAFIVNGKIAALDSPRNLIMRHGASRIQYSYIESGKEISASCPLDKTSGDLTLRGLVAEGRLSTIHSCEPNLGDIFMEMTGRRLA